MSLDIKISVIRSHDQSQLVVISRPYRKLGLDKALDSIRPTKKLVVRQIDD